MDAMLKLIFYKKKQLELTVHTQISTEGKLTSHRNR